MEGHSVGDGLYYQRLGFISKYDTLGLEYISHTKSYMIYRNTWRSRNLYLVVYVNTRNDFIIFITPLEPYETEVYSIILQSIKLIEQ